MSHTPPRTTAALTTSAITLLVGWLGCAPAAPCDGEDCEGGLGGSVETCASGIASCSPYASCNDAPAGYQCACKAGYAGDGKQCADVDECATGVAACRPSETCLNTQGNYVCQPCATPLLACGASCVDPVQDAQHCGGCDTHCEQNESCVASTCVGSGSLQITATWGRAGNAELVVRTPTGKVISWSNPGANAGTDFGRMDRSDATGTGPENVFWDPGHPPPAGTYHVCLETVLFDPPPDAQLPVDYAITLQQPGMPRMTIPGMRTTLAFSDLCEPGQPTYVTSFTVR